MKTIIKLPKIDKCVKTDKNVVVKGDRNYLYVAQIVRLDDCYLDSFVKRLRWLLFGTIEANVENKDENNS